MDRRFGRKIVAVLCIAVMVMAAFAMVSSAQTTTSAPTTTGKTIVCYEAGEPEHLDPAIDWETAGGEILQNCYETLFYYPPGAVKPVGLLAKGYDVSADGKTYTFYLKDDLKFADGSKLNASSVKYSWDRGVISNLDPWAGFISKWFVGGEEYMASNQTDADIQAYLNKSAITVINETTLQVNLVAPYSYFTAMTTFTGMAIINPNIVEANGGYKANEVCAFLENQTAGSGPFVLDKWAREDSITLVKNNNYWQAPAKIDKVVIKYVADYNTRLLALQKGDADIAYIPAVHIHDVDNDTNMVVQANQQFNTNFIGFNEKIWPMNELNFRKALVMSFDQKTDIEKVAMGYADPLTGFLPKGFEEYDPSLKGYEFNPTEAKKLLDAMDFKNYKEAGLGGDINRFLHSIGLANNQTTITLFYNAGNDGRKTACLLLKDQVEKYDSGLKIDVQELDWPTYMAKSRAAELPVIYLGWLADYPAPDNFAFAIATTTGDCAVRIAYENPANDQLYEQAIAETDLAKRKALYDQMVTNVNNDAAYIYRGQAKLLIVLRKDVKGYQFAPLDNWMIYYNLDK